MKILLAADGSRYTKKALAFVVTHEAIAAGAELVVLHVQPALPPRVKSLVGASAVAGYQADEAAKVLTPIGRFLDRHGIPWRSSWVVGQPADAILKAVQKEKAHLVVMGTHGHGLVGRALMGSVAQQVVTGCEVPVLLVK